MLHFLLMQYQPLVSSMVSIFRTEYQPLESITNMSSNNNKQFLVNQIMWLAIWLGISFAISILLPFPFSIVVVIVIFILLNLYLRKKMTERMGIGGGVGIFGSMSSANDSSLKYYCMSCGRQHKETACPECGSKMKRAG